MVDFSDPDHSVSELVFQGAHRIDPFEHCDADVLEALARWSERDAATDPAAKHFNIADTRCFSIGYQGQSSGYWPDEERNWLSEGLVRDFLFRDGLCVIEDFEPRLYDVHFKIQGQADNEFLLICPFPTEAGNVGGIVVVCVDRHMKTSSA